MDRLDRIEKRLDRIEDELGLPPIDGEDTDTKSTQEIGSDEEENKKGKKERPSASPAGTETSAPARQGLVAWMLQNPLLKVGGFLVLLAALWFIGEAYFWLGPVGRVLCGVGFGLGFMGLGTILMDNMSRSGGIVIGLGTLIALASAYGAVLLYGLVGRPLGALFAAGV